MGQKRIFDTLPAHVWSARSDGSAEFFNRRWLDYTGLHAQQALDEGWAVVIHPDDRADMLERWHACVVSGEDLQIEARIRRSDGEHRWFLICASALRGADGNILKWYGTNTDVEDRRRAEQVARSGEQNLRVIVDSVPGLVHTTTASGEIDFVNRPLLEYFDRSFEELQAWQTTDAVHPEDLARVIEVWQQGVASEQPHEFEHRLRRADGVYRWFHYRNVPLRDADRRVIGWCGLLTDIDELQQTHDATRISERSLSLLIDSIPALVFTTTPAGEVEFVNRQLLDYFGRSLEDLQAWQMADVVHPDDLPTTIAMWSRGVATGQAYEFEERLRRSDGIYRSFLFRAAPLCGEQADVIRWYGVVSDIDDLKRAQEKSRADERDLRLLIDSIPGLVYTMTPQCRLERVNRQVLDYFGRTFEELQEWERIGCVHPDDLPRVTEGLRRTAELGEPQEIEQRLRRADGVYRWFKPRAIALRDAAGQIVRWYCLLADIDDRRRAEEALRSTQARLSRATHLATMSELSASIAHEINQPLAALVANGHACRRWLTAEPLNLQKALLTTDWIIRDGNAASAIIQRIRSLFQRAPLLKDSLQMNEVIAEICSLMADELHARGVSLATNLQPTLPPVLGDRIQIQQVLVNLVRNAAEAGGTGPAHTQHVSIASRSEDDEVIIEVTDDGVGIGDTELLFEPFYTTKPNGMGMGLAVCRSIVEAHDGRLWAVPNALRGASFRFAISAQAPSQSPA